MLHLAPLLLCFIWSGFVVQGLELSLFGAFHWLGIFAIGCMWTLFAMISDM